MPDQQPLDSYSQIVTGVAAELTRRWPACGYPSPPERGGRGGESLGSARGLHRGRLPAHQRARGGRRHGGTAAFADGTTPRSRVVGADPLSDLAVLRAAGATPPPAELGEADQLVVGQLVVAVGNPLGLAGSVTAGRGQRPGPVAADPQRGCAAG